MGGDPEIEDWPRQLRAARNAMTLWVATTAVAILTAWKVFSVGVGACGGGMDPNDTPHPLGCVGAAGAVAALAGPAMGSVIWLGVRAWPRRRSRRLDG